MENALQYLRARSSYALLLRAHETHAACRARLSRRPPPPPACPQVLTVYVAHDIQSQEADPRVDEFLASDPLIVEKGLDVAKCRAALAEIGFDDERLESAISTLSGAPFSAGVMCFAQSELLLLTYGLAACLSDPEPELVAQSRGLLRWHHVARLTGCLHSGTAPFLALARRRRAAACHAAPCPARRKPQGMERNNSSRGAGGWKMKLALARAMLLDAGLLLLDEPTNHMDTANVQWLQQYLLTCGITLITVSHDSRFLDAVCTGIIHFEGKKLVKYKGNLSAFVAQKPEAAAYYKLTDEFLQFNFPVPGPLDGVKCAPGHARRVLCDNWQSAAAAPACAETVHEEVACMNARSPAATQQRLCLRPRH
jgi:ABC-type nitrate/sulfonate/bicarbonate transport system ATPase subunit